MDYYTRSRMKDVLFALPPWVARAAMPIAPIGNPFLHEIEAGRLIFIHVPKAAGSSVKTEFLGTHEGGHRRIVEFAATNPAKTRAFFKFAFVRNPWDRMLSAYSYLTQGAGTTGRDRDFATRFLSDKASFDDFVLALRDSAYRRRVMAYDHFRPQSYWICLPGARTHAMDFLGRFEHIDEDLASCVPASAAKRNRSRRSVPRSTCLTAKPVRTGRVT